MFYRTWFFLFCLDFCFNGEAASISVEKIRALTTQFARRGSRLVEHTAQHPNSRPALQTLDLHKLRRIGRGSLPLVEMAGVEPASENSFQGLSTSVADHLGFPSEHVGRQTCSYGSLCCMTETETLFRSRSPLIDALIRAAVLSVRTAA